MRVKNWQDLRSASGHGFSHAENTDDSCLPAALRVDPPNCHPEPPAVALARRGPARNLLSEGTTSVVP